MTWEPEVLYIQGTSLPTAPLPYQFSWDGQQSVSSDGEVATTCSPFEKHGVWSGRLSAGVKVLTTKLRAESACRTEPQPRDRARPTPAQEAPRVWSALGKGRQCRLREQRQGLASPGRSGPVLLRPGSRRGAGGS